ncbi:hypothetical protein F4818DRAFT_456919 [Hypoxylon cercidicola]|nr:hypothetical protein F4818DRAFT_456919 [Hypoxylon cercidicola]
MENPRERARASWVDAQEIRSDILAKINSLKKERGNANTTSRFEEAEDALAQLRLACMNAIFFDFEYAIAKNVENALWQTHTFLNAEYRKTTGRLTSPSQVVVRRRLDRQYRGFLKTSESFYSVYIQKLYERFYIPELHHIALGPDIELAPTCDSNSTLPPALSAMILKSCQVTLVHLGDLARYRFQISDRHSDRNSRRLATPHPSFDKAMEYYNLANALDPNDGSSHNQMAVLYQLRHQDLDIVYHFHRSLCVEKPHQLGIVNIEQKFASLENHTPSRRSHVQNPSDAMVTWFLRLHAFFFKGEQFTQQSELETEVLHRIELAAKSGADEVLLRKMTFINIAAYDVALEKVTKSWTMQGSQSAQFLLRFNIRTVAMLLRLLKTGLLDESATFPAPEDENPSTGDGESPICFSQLLMTLFPLIRLYISWIYVSRADAEKYREFLEPYVSDVYRLLADTLTLLNAIIDEATNTTTSSKYLLPEDAEALGLRPFSDENLPLFVQTVELFSPKKDKARKPRQRVFGYQYQTHTEALWRIRDIVYCGILLAESPTYPLALYLANHDGRNIECWSFTDDAPSQTSMSEASMSRMLNKLKFGDTKPKPEKSESAYSQSKLGPSGVDTAGPSDVIAAGPSRVDTPESSQHSSGANRTDPKPQRRLDKGKSVMKQAPISQVDADLIRDSEMIDMVNKLVDPVEDSRPQSSQAHTDTSYGMNTTMANDIFGGLNTDSAQPSPKFKAIPNLSWDYFYAPTPHRSDSQGGNVQLNSNGDYVPRSVQDQLDGFDSSLYLNELVTPSPAYHNATEGARPQTSGPQGVSPHHNHRSKDSRDSLEMSRNAVLDSINNSLYAQHGLAPNKLQPSKFTNPMDANPFGPLKSTPGTSASPFSAYFPEAASPQLRSPGKITSPNYMERSISQQSIYATVGSGKQSAPNGGSQSRLSDILRDSSPDDDDDMGFSAPGSQGQLRGRNACKNVAPGPPLPQSRSPFAQESVKFEPLTFSHPSSLFGGTPAPPSGPPNTFFSNGHFYNASTPFGRLGSDYNSRDDPTSFRNQLQSLIGDSAFDAYDKQVLESALLDDKGKPAQK